MHRLIALVTLACAAQAAGATVFSYDSGPVSGVGFQTEILFSFETDVTDGFVYSGNGGFTATGLKLFYDGQQNGSGDFSPMGYLGSVSNGVLSLSFAAPSYVSYVPPFGGPRYTGHGAPISFSGTITAAVPEPASWTLMLGGFGLVGTALRRHRRVSGFA